MVIALYEKIKNREIEEYFTQKEINEILTDIKTEFNLDSVRPWNNIKDNLFHYFLRSHPDEPWKYYIIARDKRKKKLSKIGLILLVISFLLQIGILISNRYDFF